MKEIVQNCVVSLAVALGLSSSFNLQPSTARAQGAAFTYQGRVTDNGTNFTGAGQFKFALVTSTNFNHQATAAAHAPSGGFVTLIDVTFGGSGYVSAPAVTIFGGGGANATAHATLTGGVVTSISVDNPGSGYTSTPSVTVAPPPANIAYATFWSNDGTSVAGSEPSAAVSVGASSGLFTVVLGDTTLANMMAVDAALFNQPNLQLRIWFSDGVNGFAALSPVQTLRPAPYAVAAHSADSASNLLGTLPATQLTGTIPATQLPSGVVTNNATSLNLSGAFSGNGSGLTNVPGGLSWNVVSGATQQAQPNTGYIATDNSLVTVTLPAAPDIGDVMRVSGKGAGGWKIAQNAGQFVSSANLGGNIGLIWQGRGATNRNWTRLASSADGTKLVAGVSGDHIYTSSDSGVTWLVQNNSPYAVAIASSADGIKLVATDGGYLYTSTNSGATWQSRLLAPGMSEWAGVAASSADGTKLVAAIFLGSIYTSADSGVTWTPRTNSGSNQWSSIASSADGTKLIAAAPPGLLYTSTDSGVTWKAQTNGIPNGGSQNWSCVASSADGTKLVAGIYSGGGPIYCSADSGATWTARASSQQWDSIASSSDGSKLVAAVFGGQIYTSSDSGVTWMARDSSRNWESVACSADGAKIAATAYNDQIYTSVPSSVSSTTTGATGYLLGDPNSAIELQFLGNGQFLPISHEGIIQAF